MNLPAQSTMLATMLEFSAVRCSRNIKVRSAAILKNSSLLAQPSDCADRFMVKAALALGANLGDRKNNILTAIERVVSEGLLTDVRTSSILENKALCPVGASKEWDKDFLNCVIVGNTDMDPFVLLDAVKRIEKSLGRIDRERWAPREIDIDILLYGNRRISTSTLTIPHPELLNRQFAMDLLAEVEPGLCPLNQGSVN